ncbi:hypothetical protein U0070_006882 [Myodes glareolus]|uniref:Uncharacterized protein n=1 Tax=Myodes glareolus TaxID=447135 RepID=A0AAW0HAI1_MYOGA
MESLWAHWCHRVLDMHPKRSCRRIRGEGAEINQAKLGSGEDEGHSEEETKMQKGGALNVNAFNCSTPEAEAGWRNAKVTLGALEAECPLRGTEGFTADAIVEGKGKEVAGRRNIVHGMEFKARVQLGETDGGMVWVEVRGALKGIAQGKTHDFGCCVGAAQKEPAHSLAFVALDSLLQKWQHSFCFLGFSGNSFEGNMVVWSQGKWKVKEGKDRHAAWYQECHKTRRIWLEYSNSPLPSICSSLCGQLLEKQHEETTLFVLQACDSQVLHTDSETFLTIELPAGSSRDERPAVEKVPTPSPPPIPPPTPYSTPIHSSERAGAGKPQEHEATSRTRSDQWGDWNYGTDCTTRSKHLSLGSTGTWKIDHQSHSQPQLHQSEKKMDRQGPADSFCKDSELSGDSAYGKCLRDFSSITNSCGRKELEWGLPAVKVCNREETKESKDEFKHEFSVRKALHCYILTLCTAAAHAQLSHSFVTYLPLSCVTRFPSRRNTKNTMKVTVKLFLKGEAAFQEKRCQRGKGLSSKRQGPTDEMRISRKLSSAVNDTRVPSHLQPRLTPLEVQPLAETQRKDRRSKRLEPLNLLPTVSEKRKKGENKGSNWDKLKTKRYKVFKSPRRKLPSIFNTSDGILSSNSLWSRTSMKPSY